LKKYAIFGGSFDPPHLCHEELVKKCLKELGLDKLFLIPTFLSPFKSAFAAPPKMRYEWLCKVFEKYEKVSVLDIEIKKQKAVFTIDTIEELTAIIDKQSCDKIYLIIGSDNLCNFTKWHRYEELIKLVEVVVVSRGSTTFGEYKTIFLECAFSSSEYRNLLDPQMLSCEIREAVMSFYEGKN